MQHDQVLCQRFIALTAENDKIRKLSFEKPKLVFTQIFCGAFYFKKKKKLKKIFYSSDV